MVDNGSVLSRFRRNCDGDADWIGCEGAVMTHPHTPADKSGEARDPNRLMADGEPEWDQVGIPHGARNNTASPPAPPEASAFTKLLRDGIWRAHASETQNVRDEAADLIDRLTAELASRMDEAQAYATKTETEIIPRLVKAEEELATAKRERDEKDDARAVANAMRAYHAESARLEKARAETAEADNLRLTAELDEAWNEGRNAGVRYCRESEGRYRAIVESHGSTTAEIQAEICRDCADDIAALKRPERPETQSGEKP